MNLLPKSAMIGLSINEDGQGKYILEIRKGKLPMTAKPAEVASLDPITMQTLCEEYIANNYIDPETSEKLGVKRGLRNPDGTGVLAGLTNVCDLSLIHI